MDIENLTLKIRKSDLDEVVTAPNKWKIAILNCNVDDPNYDFHFLRQSADGQWFQRSPGDQHASNHDARNQIISNPEEAKYFYKYHLLGYYVIEM